MASKIQAGIAKFYKNLDFHQVITQKPFNVRVLIFYIPYSL